MATILDELVSILGFQLEGKENLDAFKRGLDDASKKSESFGASIVGAAKGAVAGLAAIGVAVKGATAGMFAMANAAAGPLDEIVKAADRAGVSVEAMQELGFVAEQSGSSVGEMTNAVEMMSRRLAEAARGQGRAKTALEAYGLSATDASGNIKNAADFMGELADTFQGLSEAERLDLGRQLGLSRGLITMLAQGNDEIDRLRQVARDAGLIFTDEDARNAEAYNDAMNLLMRTVRSMRDRIAIDLLPTLMQMIGGMQEWFNANREVIQQNVGDFLQRMARHSRTLSDALSQLNESSFPLKELFMGLLFVFRRTWFFWLLFAGAVDDLLTYISGEGDSIIGRFIVRIQEITGASEGAAEAIAGITIALGALLAWGGWRALKAKMASVFFGGAAAGTAGGAAAGGGVLGAIGGFLAKNVGNIGRASVQGLALFAGQEAITRGLDKLDEMLGLDPDRLGDFDTSTGGIIGRLGERIQKAAPKPRARSDQAAAPEEIPQYGRQTAAESISVPLSSMGGERFTPSIGGQVNDSRDQSTNIDVGGITVNPSAGMDERGLAARIRDRLLSIHGQTPVTP